MTFEEVWDSVQPLTRIVVSLGTATQAVEGSVAHRTWQSHNFEGVLTQKRDATPRVLLFMLDADGKGNQVGYEVVEGLGHEFVPAGPAAPNP